MRPVYWLAKLKARAGFDLQMKRNSPTCSCREQAGRLNSNPISALCAALACRRLPTRTLLGAAALHSKAEPHVTRILLLSSGTARLNIDRTL